ncbi:hypothetical protein MTBSS4_190005 [Magnetospirillum sp. SS-4]|nr:hypothetical protein MTBSS4_190005 [Magnetospirillum sp. SS-4]
MRTANGGIKCSALWGFWWLPASLFTGLPISSHAMSWRVRMNKFESHQAMIIAWWNQN